MSAQISAETAAASKQTAAELEALAATLEQIKSAAAAAQAGATNAAVVTALQNTYSVLEVARGVGANRRQQLWLLQNGLNAAENRDLFLAESPLSVTTFLEQVLPSEEHYVITHAKPLFSALLKAQRIKQFEEEGARFWVGYVQHEFRILYTASDRKLMCSILDSSEMQRHLQRHLKLHRPCRPATSWREASRRGGTQPGPLVQYDLTGAPAKA